MKTTRVLAVKAEIETPKVPNFVKQTNGQWLPLCALNETGLRTLGEAWTECLIERSLEQSKDADKFYSMAVKGGET